MRLASFPSFLQPSDKQSASALEDRCTRLSDAVEVAALGVIGLAVAGQALLAGVLEGGLILTRVASGKLGRAAQRFAGDPAKFNYTDGTVVVRAPFYRDVLDETAVPAVSAIANFAADALEAQAHIEAMVRAIEKAQGAAVILSEESPPATRDPERIAELLRARLDEAAGFAVGAADALEALASHAPHTADELHRALPTFEAENAQRRRGERRGGRLDSVLSPDALTLLFRAGVRIEDLRVSTRPELAARPSSEEIGVALWETGHASAEFAAALRHWKPLL